MNIYQTNDCLDIKQATLLRSTIEETDLTGTLITKVRMASLTVRDVDLSFSSFERAGAADTMFTTVDFSRASFARCNFAGATIDGIEIEAMLATYRASMADRSRT